MSLTTYENDTDALREAFGHYPSGVAALAAVVDGQKQVLVASSFMVGISLDPPLVLFSVQKNSSTWPLLRQAPLIGVSLLASDQAGLTRQLASKDRPSRWNDVSFEETDGGAVFLNNAALSLECSTWAEHEAGDHDLVILEVKALHTAKHIEPLVFHGSRFRELS